MVDWGEGCWIDGFEGVVEFQWILGERGGFVLYLCSRRAAASMLLVFLGADSPGISRYSKGFIIAHSGSGSDVRRVTFIRMVGYCVIVREVQVDCMLTITSV